MLWYSWVSKFRGPVSVDEKMGNGNPRSESALASSRRFGLLGLWEGWSSGRQHGILGSSMQIENIQQVVCFPQLSKLLLPNPSEFSKTVDELRVGKPLDSTACQIWPWEIFPRL